MAKGTRICEICGKEYPYCYTNRPAGMFRWQDVGCCPEHAEQFFMKVLEDRGQLGNEALVAEMREACGSPK